jgi:hypothetical protein
MAPISSMHDAQHPGPLENGSLNPKGQPVVQKHEIHRPGIKDEAIENFRPMSVIVIGAGFSGIYCGVRIPERLRNVKLTIYEKNAGVGGTWYENRYPGCACDIPGGLNNVNARLLSCRSHCPSTFLPIHVCAESRLEYLLCSSRRDPEIS